MKGWSKNTLGDEKFGQSSNKGYEKVLSNRFYSKIESQNFVGFAQFLAFLKARKRDSPLFFFSSIGGLEKKKKEKNKVKKSTL